MKRQDRGQKLLMLGSYTRTIGSYSMEYTVGLSLSPASVKVTVAIIMARISACSSPRDPSRMVGGPCRFD